MRFSQRIGKTSIRDVMQIDSIDELLTNKLWNNILTDFFDKLEADSNIRGIESQKAQICSIVWTEFFGHRVDEISQYSNGGIYVPDFIKYLKNHFLQCEWYEKYDLIEFLSLLEKGDRSLRFTEACNCSLKREMAAYRVIDCKVVKITSEQEVEEIETALSTEWETVNTHLRSALFHLSNRESPDYRNSIKESISAVESLCILLSGDKSATLGKALGIIEKQFQIHGALKQAFSSLYGYTSDSSGIRHALLDGNISLSFEDAKFMLVSCSAFINYLRSKIK